LDSIPGTDRIAVREENELDSSFLRLYKCQS
jgi:hypothetical protein